MKYNRYNKIAENLKNNFFANSVITKKQIIEEYVKEYEKSEVKIELIITWLKKLGVIAPITKDKYIIKKYNPYNIRYNSEEIGIYKEINKEYPDLKVAVWNTSNINNFTQHHATTTYIIVEVEKIGVEIVTALLKEKFSSKYTITNDDILSNNILIYLSTEKLIVVKNMISLSPLTKNKDIIVPKFEKILVDLYIDKVYYMFKENELKYIYENAFELSDIDLTKLYMYAKRRNKENDIKQFINSLNINEVYKI